MFAGATLRMQEVQCEYGREFSWRASATDVLISFIGANSDLAGDEAMIRTRTVNPWRWHSLRLHGSEGRRRVFPRVSAAFPEHGRRVA